MTKRKTAANTSFATGGLTCKIGVLCFYLSSMFLDIFIIQNPTARQALNRWLLYFSRSSLQAQAHNLGTRIIIANPIYDTIFRRMMENECVAKIFIETLLEQHIETVK